MRRLLDALYDMPAARNLAKRCLPPLLRLSPARLRRRLLHSVENTIYRNTADVHDLPAAFHYWSETHLLPHLEAFGFRDARSFYVQQLAQLAHALDLRELRVASLGSGSAGLEIAICEELSLRGVRTRWECVELNADLQASARRRAGERALDGRFRLVVATVEDWRPQAAPHAILANQFLHHVQGVDALLRRTSRMLAPGGRLLSHDVIGRNGHRLWPNALHRVLAHWRRLPDARKRDRHGRTIEPFRDVDCSAYSLEGIEAQQILPSLLAHFQPTFFFGYGAFALTFLDRRFGHCFDPADARDRAFIDRIAAEDWQALHAGALAPTQMFGAFQPAGGAAARVRCNLPPRVALAARPG